MTSLQYSSGHNVIFALTLYLFFLGAADPNISFVEVLKNASAPTLMAVIVVGAINEWWVPGRSHRRIVAERDELLKLVIGSQEVGHKAIDTASMIAEAIRNAQTPKTP